MYKVNPTKLMAVRLDADGAALGAAVEVAPQAVDPFRGPDVAYNAATNQYLVVWNEFNPDGALGTTRGRGRLVSELGALVAPAQPIHLPMSPSGCQVQGIAVEANPTTGGYTVLYVQWSTNTTGCDGDVRVVQDEQAMIQPLGGSLQVGAKSEIRSGQAVTNYTPFLAVDPASGQHVAGVYDRVSKRHAAYLYSSNLTAGPVVQFAIPAAPGNDQYRKADIAFDAASQRWTMAAAKFGNVTYLQTFDTTGQVTVAPTKISESDFDLLQLEALGDGTFALVTINQELVHVTATGGLLGTFKVFTVGGTSAQHRDRRRSVEVGSSRGRRRQRHGHATG